jgi:aspartate kinase
MNAIVRAVKPDSVFIEDELALIAVVGRGMIKAKGTSARVCDALARADINIRIIDQGSSELNIIVGVDDDAYEDALRAIYAEFVKA